MNNLIVYTFIGHNSAPYAENLQKHCELLKSGNYNIVYKCIRTINNPQYPETERIPEGWIHVADVEAHPISNSCSHALGINRAIEDVEDNQNNTIIFCDADICILYKNWDIVVYRELLKKDLFGWESKYGFPSVFFFGFKKDTLNLVEFDFMPLLENSKLERSKKITVRDRQIAKMYNKGLGDRIKCDTGWRIPEHIFKARLDYQCVKRVISQNCEAKLPFVDTEQKELCFSRKDHMCEWHWRGQLFGTHLQASRNFGIDTNWGKIWMERISLYMKGYLGLEECGQ